MPVAWESIRILSPISWTWPAKALWRLSPRVGHPYTTTQARASIISSARPTSQPGSIRWTLFTRIWSRRRAPVTDVERASVRLFKFHLLHFTLSLFGLHLSLPLSLSVSAMHLFILPASLSTSRP